jgi:protein-S-isoprenylcysteine O-methyltransferase Ste14
MGTREAVSARAGSGAPAATRWERVGGALFRARSVTPVGVLGVALLWPTQGGLHWPLLSTAAALVVAGEALRLWAVGVAGKLTRTRGANVRELVTAGPFAIVRNPLYIGNFAVACGVVVLSKVEWLLWAFPPLFALQYAAIVAWEERVLSTAFGETYARYRAVVPRWLPSLRGAAGAGPWKGRIAWQSERDTLLGLLALVLFLIVKHVGFHGAVANLWRTVAEAVRS